MLTEPVENNPKASTQAHALNSLKVLFGGYSSSGLKAENQDAFAAYCPSSPSSNHQLVSKGSVAALADGLSCANKAAQASQLAVTQFINDYYGTPDTWATRKSAAKVLTSLNQWLYSQNSSLDDRNYIAEQKQQWLTTFSAIILKSATATIFHVGDTRISQFRQQQFETITKDHNYKQGGNSSVLTRALGADDRLQVDVHKVKLQAGDIYLLTCDGVHEFISSKKLSTLLNTLALEPKTKDLEFLSKQIVKHALKAGSDDNVSCLIVYVKSIANRKLAEIERDLLCKTIPEALEVGQKLDNYKVLKTLHASTRSHLYLVEHEDDSKPLVLKVPSINFAEDAHYRQAFMREAWLGERVKHHNIMAIRESSADSKPSNFIYYVCEFIEGQTLSDWMFDNPKPSIGQVRDIVGQIISALRVFQRLDVVHRDLKPDNIMINQFGQIKLIDYGAAFIASLDENDDTIKETVPQGSLNYIAPETLQTLKSDHQSDLFSLAVICYEMLTGKLPYKPKKQANMANYSTNQWHYRSVKHHRNELPIWLDLCLQKACHSDPNQRYLAFSEFNNDLNKPNIDVVECYKNQPLIERDPVKFWQSVSLFLFVLLIASLINQ